MYYKEKKKSFYVWLNSKKAISTELAPISGYRNKFYWELNRDIDVSKNAVMSVCGFINEGTLNTEDAMVIRCDNIPQFNVYQNNPPIIHLAKTPKSQAIDFEDINYKIGEPSNFQTISLSVGSITDKTRGMKTTQDFIIGLKFEDEDDDEIETIYKTPVSNKNYHIPNPQQI